MKKLILNILLLTIAFDYIPGFAEAGKLNFGNYSSYFLLQQAWAAFSAKDFKASEAYAGKVVDLYSKTASQMQAGLAAYPSGSNDKIFKYWALNDVGTALYILGESLRKSGQTKEALDIFHKIIDRYPFSQCWDPRGWFWKPASVAKDKIDIAAAGVDVDFGDYNSNFLVRKAWAAAAKKDLKSVVLYVNKIVELYGDKAREMQNSLKENTDTSLAYKQNTFNYWALNDVGTALFILADTYRKHGRRKEAEAIYWKIVNDYSYAQCWRREGGFWKPADSALMRLQGARIKRSLFGD